MSDDTPASDELSKGWQSIFGITRTEPLTPKTGDKMLLNTGYNEWFIARTKFKACGFDVPGIVTVDDATVIWNFQEWCVHCTQPGIGASIPLRFLSPIA